MQSPPLTFSELYNKEAAANKLSKWIADRSATSNSNEQLMELLKEDSTILSSMRVFESKFPTAWGITTKTGSDPNPVEEELVLRLQGIIVDSKLPPFADRQTLTVSHSRRLSQSIFISGCNNQEFEEAFASIRRLDHEFSRHFGQGEYEPWKSIYVGREECILVSNRYLTKRSDAPISDRIAYQPGVDPYQILENLHPDKFIHTEDNIVFYFKYDASTRTHATTLPSIFRVGDIVEVQLTFSVFPVKENKRRMLPVLRSITQLDATESQLYDERLRDLERAADAKKRAGRNMTFKGVKRKVGYSSENASKRRRMSIG